MCTPKSSLSVCRGSIWDHQITHNGCLLTTTIVNNNQVCHVTTIANGYHQPPLSLSPPTTTVTVTTHHHWPPATTTANTNHEKAMPRHHPQRLTMCLAMECVGDDVARCHVVQMVMMHAIVTVCSV